MNRIFIFFISLLAVSAGNIFAQTESPVIEDEDIEIAYTDTIPYYVRMQGIRFGLEIGGPLSYYAMGSHSLNYSISADMEIKDNWYVIAELGTSEYSLDVDTDEPSIQSYKYESTGQFLKLGFDYNVVRASNPYHKDMLSVGLRLGGSAYSHEVNDIVFEDSYWGTQISDNIGSESLTAFWAEAVLGAKAEITKNIFIGASISARFKLSGGTSDRIANTQYIPGYGKGYKSVNCGFNFSVYYTLPIGKKHQTFLKDIIDQ